MSHLWQERRQRIIDQVMLHPSGYRELEHHFQGITSPLARRTKCHQVVRRLHVQGCLPLVGMLKNSYGNGRDLVAYCGWRPLRERLAGEVRLTRVLLPYLHHAIRRGYDPTAILPEAIVSAQGQARYVGLDTGACDVREIIAPYLTSRIGRCEVALLLAASEERRRALAAACAGLGTVYVALLVPVLADPHGAHWLNNRGEQIPLLP